MTKNATNIEKTELEVHVEMCGQRYDQLYDKLNLVNKRIDEKTSDISKRIDKQEFILAEIHTAIEESGKKIFNWSLKIIGVLIVALGALFMFVLNQLV